MGRTVKGADANVTPIRHLSAPCSLDNFNRDDRQEAHKTNPYKAGEVVRDEDGTEALVIRVFIKRIWEHDPWSDLLPVCRVRRKTKSGEWSKVWKYVWPGQIARGFEKAAA